MQRAQSRRLAPTEADAYGPASIDREIRGIRFRLPHYGIIRDDHSCSRLKFISELVSEIGTKAQSRRQSSASTERPSLVTRIHRASSCLGVNRLGFPVVPSSIVNKWLTRRSPPVRPRLLISTAARPIGLPLR